MMSTLGERIKARRSQLKITQNKLAEMLETDQKQISKYETAKQVPSADVVAKISQHLRTTSDWLLGLTDNIDKPLRDAKDLDLDEKELIKAYRQGDLQRALELMVIHSKEINTKDVEPV